MKLAFVLTLLSLVGCLKKADVKSGDTIRTPVIEAVAGIQGTWELCTDSGGSAGDYKMIHEISGTTYKYTEINYSSMGGLCTGPIATTTGEFSIYKGSSSSENWPEAFSVNVRALGPKKIKALTSDQDALDLVIHCSKNSSPSVGVEYSVVEKDCNYTVMVNEAGVTDQVLYSIAYVETAVSPHVISFGAGVDPDDGSTEAKRHEYLESTEYAKK